MILRVSQELCYLLTILVAMVGIKRFHDCVDVGRTWMVYVERQPILPVIQKERI
jgi:hypothetical protein